MEYIRVSFDPNDVRDVIANGNVVGPDRDGAHLAVKLLCDFPIRFRIFPLVLVWRRQRYPAGAPLAHPVQQDLGRVRMRGACLLLLCLVLAGGCASTHFENTPLRAGEANPDRRSIDPATPDRPVILMTFSGGGSRAAALAEAVLREMAATSYPASDGNHVLTSDVKLISSVSGGSVTSAWFGLHRSPAHPDGDLDGLRNDFLAKDNMAALELDAVNPITWFGLVTGKIARIEALEALFNERLFHNATLADINRPGQPYVVFNATDMAGGETFALVPRKFDDVCRAMMPCRSLPRWRHPRHSRSC